MANKDTVSQNFYLYNPKHSDTFYLLPWDYDGASRDINRYAKWELGYGVWWGIPLHKKFLRIKKNRDDLDAMVTYLRENYITPQTVQAKLDRYRVLVEPFIGREPDSTILHYYNWEEEFESLPARLDVNIQNYRSQIGSPMPFWQSFSYEDGNLTLIWEESVDFEGDPIVYDIELGYTPDLNTTIIDKKGLSVENGDLNITPDGRVSYSEPRSFPSGTVLYMKVTAREASNPDHYQIAFNKEVRIGRIKFYGVMEIIIE
jgi:spore coat protein H